MAQKLYFTVEELNPHKYQLTQEQVNNLTMLIERVSKVRELYGKAFTVTSGVRDLAYQMKVNPKAPQSKHLIGAAVDIYDPDLSITKWLKANPKVLEDAQLWCEEGNADWVHFQSIPPKSGKRWFLP